jgi:hypothetical protein
MPVVTAVTVAAPPCRAQRSPGGSDPSAAHLPGGVVEPPVRLVCRLEQAQLAGAGGLERVAVSCCVHVLTMPRGCDNEAQSLCGTDVRAVFVTFVGNY